jgi:hypothetical protein
VTYEKNIEEIDTEVFGFDVYSLKSASNAPSLTEQIKEIESLGRTAYLVLRIGASETSEIERVENHGFHYVETSFSTTARLQKGFDTTRYPYEYHKIESLAELDEVCEIADRTTNLDRFTLDPLIGKRLSGKRYVRYLQRSFQDASEEIWAVRSRKSKRLLTFRSHRWVSADRVRLLNGGVHPDFKESGLGVVSTHFCFNSLMDFGARRADTQISAANIPIVNLEVGHLNFKVTKTFVTLRKVVNWKF